MEFRIASIDGLELASYSCIISNAYARHVKSRDELDVFVAFVFLDEY